jgi:alpha-1,3-mannosyltransferase
MNILLFAPALFLAYMATGGIIRAMKQVSVCALMQVIIGFPFLKTYPIEYLKGSFDIGRVFLFKWTVNWSFVPEEIFVHRGFHAVLLVMHVLVLLYLAPKWWKMLKAYSKDGNAGKNNHRTKTLDSWQDFCGGGEIIGDH